MIESEAKGKVVLVSGGSSGIGAAIAYRCGAAGATAWVGYASGEERARAVAEAIRAKGGQAQAVKLDVSDRHSIRDAVAKVIADSGRVDALVNCAGVNIGGPLISLEPEAVETQVTVNLTGAILLSREALTHMVRARSGSILNIGSVSAHRVVRGHSVYSAAKAGLEGFTRALAAEVAKRGIRVNCLIPGPVRTPMLERSMAETGDDPASRVPMGRVLEPEEAAEAAFFLLFEGAKGVTGASVPVDGGYLLW